MTVIDADARSSVEVQVSEAPSSCILTYRYLWVVVHMIEELVAALALLAPSVLQSMNEDKNEEGILSDFVIQRSGIGHGSVVSEGQPTIS